MPNQPKDTSTPTVRQVLDRAITGIENLRLLLEEAETLTHCAGLSLDALPWSSSGSAQADNRSGSGSGSAQADNRSGGSGGGSGSGSSPAQGPNLGQNPGSAAPVNQPPTSPYSNTPNTDSDDFDLDDFDSIAYFDPGDLTRSDGISQGEIGEYDPEDRTLALGRLHTLTIAAGKASKRSLRYCQRLQHYLQRAMTRLDRGEFDKRGAVEGAAGFAQPWLKSDDDPEATR